MIVCPLCKKELKCVKTGMAVRYHENGEHCYAGDVHRCPSCGLEVVVTNPNSFYDPEATKKETAMDVWMDADKGYRPSPPTDRQIDNYIDAHDLCLCSDNSPHNPHIGCG